MDKLNWVTTGGAFGLTRRFPSFTVKVNEKTGMLMAFDDEEGGRFKTLCSTIEEMEKILRPYIDRRTL